MRTYNDEKYIAQAIESVLMQKTNFDFELIIGEDCSTDRTKEIIYEYRNKYRDIIKPTYRNKNVGLAKNLVETYFLCTGKYVAILDGDDYWTDPLKLQKQVYFFDKHNDCVVCSHDVLTIFEDKIKEPFKFPIKTPNKITTLKDILKEFYTPTLSLMVVNGLIKEFPTWYFDLRGGEDWIFVAFHAEYGNIGHINEVMANYRTHSETSFSSIESIQKIKYGLSCYEQLYRLYGHKYNAIMRPTMSKYYLKLSKQYQQNLQTKKFISSLANCFRYSPIYFIRYIKTIIKLSGEMAFLNFKKYY